MSALEYLLRDAGNLVQYSQYSQYNDVLVYIEKCDLASRLG